MCKAIEDIVNEEIKEEKKATAIKMLEEGLPIEQIARILRLTADKVEELINGGRMLV